MAEQKVKPDSGEKADSGTEEGHKSSKRMLILVIVLFVLVVNGVVLYALGFIPAYKLQDAAIEEKTSEHAEEPAAPKVPLFVPLAPPFIVNLPPGSDARLIQAGLTVLTFDPAVVEALKKHSPMLRNNLNLLLSEQESAKLRTLEGKQALQAMILEEVGKVARMQVPEGSVEQVFFTSYVLQ
jgi:flagellar FliL protein